MRQRQRGFTLVEMMVGLAILSIVTIAMAGTFLVASRAVSNEARAIAADEAVSGASLWLTRDLNSAAALPALPVTINLANTLTLTYGSPPVVVVYSVNNNRDLVRTVNGAATTAARGVTSVTVTAAGCSASVTIQPPAAGAPAAAFNGNRRPAGCW